MIPKTLENFHKAHSYFGGRGNDSDEELKLCTLESELNEIVHWEKFESLKCQFCKDLCILSLWKVVTRSSNLIQFKKLQTKIIIFQTFYKSWCKKYFLKQTNENFANLSLKFLKFSEIYWGKNCLILFQKALIYV